MRELQRAAARICTALSLVTPVPALADTSADLREGLRWQSEDGQIQIHAGGVYAGDLVWNDSNNTQGSGLRTDLAKPILEGRYREDFRARIAFDLEGTKTAGNLYEAFLAWEGQPGLRLSTGLLQLPLNFEHGTRPEDLSLIGHSFASYLNPRTDWAVRAEGQASEGVFEWDASYAFGHGFDINGLRQKGPRASLRAFARPLRSRGPSTFLGSWFFGASYAYLWDWEGSLRVRNPSGTRLFDTSTFEADTGRFWNLAVGIEPGPVRIVWERTLGMLLDADTPAGTQDLDDEISSWHATVSWMVVGPDYDGRIFGERDRDPPGPNAWEVALRYANADIDRNFFDFGLTSPLVSSQEFRSITATVNWYVNPNLRLSLAYVRTMADDDIKSLDFQGDGHTGVLRAQVRF